MESKRPTRIVIPPNPKSFGNAYQKTKDKYRGVIREIKEAEARGRVKTDWSDPLYMQIVTKCTDPVKEDMDRFDAAQGMFVRGVNYAKNSDLLERANKLLSSTTRDRTENVTIIATMVNTGVLPRRTVRADGTPVDPENDNAAPEIKIGMPILGSAGELAKGIGRVVMFIWRACFALDGNGEDQNLEKIASLVVCILQDMSNYPAEAEHHMSVVMRGILKACIQIRDAVEDNERNITASAWRKSSREMFKQTLFGVGESLSHLESGFQRAQECRTDALAPLLNPTGSTRSFADEYGVEVLELNADKLKEILVNKFKIDEIEGLPSFEDEGSTLIDKSKSGCGNVYKVEDAKGELFAVKLLPVEGNVSTTCLRYIREVRGWRLLDHENILPFYGVRLLFDGRLPGLVSKWCNGGNVLAYLQQRPDATVETRIFFILEAALGLQHVHSKGVIHNDIKAENIVIHDNGDGEAPQVYLCDFGSSRLLGDVRGTTTSKGCTALFLAPEVALNLAPQSKASDMFSFGCVFLQVVYDKTPYLNIFRNESDLYKARRDGHGPEKYFEASFTESLPATHLNFMKRCWDAVPSKRFTASQAVEEIVLNFEG